MKVRLVGSSSAGTRPEAADGIVLLVPDRATAAKVRARHPAARLLVAGDRLPFVDGALDEVVDERAASGASVEEDARVVRTGGRVALVSDAQSAGGLAAVLGGLWKKQRPPLTPTDASAWLLGAGCAELEQRTTKDGAILTEGRVDRT